MATCTSSKSSPSPMSSRPNPKRDDPERDYGGAMRGFGRNLKCEKASRSFHHPCTPANSPAAGFGGRCSLGSGNLASWCDSEQKENDKDHNARPSRARSPSPSRSLSRGARNFMSPTISAASKINASPNRRVLGERNAAFRASASLSDGKSIFFSVDSLPVSDNEDNSHTSSSEELSSTVAIAFEKGEGGGGGGGSTLPTKEYENNVHSSNTLNLDEPDLVVIGPVIPLNSTQPDSLTSPETPVAVTKMGLCANNGSSSPCVIAPLDADPSLPPYDPKSNYLSPRPRFLRYRPNPRIELYFSNNGKVIEDNFFAETSLETESSHETQSEDSEKECEDASSGEMANPNEESPKLGCEDGSPVEPMLDFSEPDTDALLMANERKTNDSKPRFISRWKAIALLFLLSLAFFPIFVLETPSSFSGTLKSEAIFQLFNDSRTTSEPAATLNLNPLLPNVWSWPPHLKKHMFEITPWRREFDKLSLLQVSNSTFVQDLRYHAVDHTGGLVPYEDGESEVCLMIKEIGLPAIPVDSNLTAIVPEWKSSLKTKTLPAADRGGEMISNGLAVEEVKGNFGAFLVPSPNELEYDLDHNNRLQDEKLNDHVEVDYQLVLPPPPKKDCDSCINMESEKGEKAQQCSLVMGDSTGPVSEKDYDSSIYNIDSGKNNEAQQGRLVMEDSAGPLSEKEYHSSIDIESEKSKEQEESSLVVEGSAANLQVIDALGMNNRFLDPGCLGFYYLLGFLLAIAAGFMVLKPKKKSNQKDISSLIKEFPTEKAILKPAPSSFHGSPSSDSGPVEVDMGSEPCPSEVSSAKKSSSCHVKKGLNVADEVQSQERKPRRNHKRESLASSSDYTIGSTSYGSFTTHSIIHSKHGDEEVVTPIRRSSRIRNQVTHS